MRRLQAGGDAKRTQPGHVGGIDQLDMFDAVAAVAGPVGGAGGLIAVDHRTHRAIADGMDRDLQAAPVDLGRDSGETLGRKQRLGAMAGLVGIVLQQIGGAAVDHSVHEHLDEARADPVTLEIRRHGRGAVQRL